MLSCIQIKSSICVSIVYIYKNSLNFQSKKFNFDRSRLRFIQMIEILKNKNDICCALFTNMVIFSKSYSCICKNTVVQMKVHQFLNVWKFKFLQLLTLLKIATVV